MKPSDVKEQIGELPWMTIEQAKKLTQFIHDHKIKQILELGFYHGVSTCYMAAAVSKFADSSITTIDKDSAKDLSPTIDKLLTQLGLRDLVTIIYEPKTYLWRLMKLLEENETPVFDFCYIDGAHQWKTDGFAFFLVNQLLKPGGWIIFDDLEWKAANLPKSFKSKSWVQKMTKEEKETAQIRKVYELLVKRHPDYHNYRTEDGWAYVQKIEGARYSFKIKSETIVKPVPVPLDTFKEYINRQ